MARWAPAKKDQLDALASEILHNYSRGRALVAVDGRHGAGQREFADDLAAALVEKDARVFRASIDDFFRPRRDREREGWLDGKAHYREAYDYSLLRRVLVDPFHTGGSTGFVLTGFDEALDQPVFQPKWMSAGFDAILIVDGVFLNRSELAGLWNYSIWLTTPLLAVQDQQPQGAESGRAEQGRADQGQAEQKRNVESDEAYLRDANPSEKATTLIDNQDIEHPRRVFADSC